MLDDMIDLIIAAHLAMEKDSADFYTAANTVVQVGICLYKDKPTARREWIEQLYDATRERCGCEEILSISSGVRVDKDMEALEKVMRCLATLAEQAITNRV